MSSLEFREAIPGDEAMLLPMMRALAKQDPEVIPFNESFARAAFHQFLSLPAFGRIWLLYDSAALVGYVRGHDAFIDELYIVPTHRHRGFGLQTMAFVEQAAREMGVNAIHLEVDPGNDSALKLYRRTGYVDHDRFLMTKWLERDSK